MLAKFELVRPLQNSIFGIYFFISIHFYGSFFYRKNIFVWVYICVGKYLHVHSMMI